MNWLRKAWAWMRADWKRLLLLPAVAIGIIAACRRGADWLSPRGRPPPAGTLSPEEGDEVKELIKREAEADRLGFRATAEALRERIRKARKGGG